MSSTTDFLPSDPAALRALAVSLQQTLATRDRELAARNAELHNKTLHIEKLRATLALMKRARFSRSSERSDQLELLIGDLEEAEAEHQAREATAQSTGNRFARERPRQLWLSYVRRGRSCGFLSGGLADLLRRPRLLTAPSGVSPACEKSWPRILTMLTAGREVDGLQIPAPPLTQIAGTVADAD